MNPHLMQKRTGLVLQKMGSIAPIQLRRKSRVALLQLLQFLMNYILS